MQKRQLQSTHRNLPAQAAGKPGPQQPRPQNIPARPRIPGWPARGRFNQEDWGSIFGTLGEMDKLIAEFIADFHEADHVLQPHEEAARHAYAYDALYFANDILRCVTLTRSAPTFHVSLAYLREKGFPLPKSADSARREIEKVVSRVRREQSEAPEAEPDQAGPTCKRFPFIALGVANHRAGRWCRHSTVTDRH